MDEATKDKIDKLRQKLPDYTCMICGRNQHLAAVPRPMYPGETGWWVCRPGHGCALDTNDRAGML